MRRCYSVPKESADELGTCFADTVIQFVPDPVLSQVATVINPFNLIASIFCLVQSAQANEKLMVDRFRQGHLHFAPQPQEQAPRQPEPEGEDTSGLVDLSGMFSEQPPDGEAEDGEPEPADEPEPALA